MGRLWDEGGAGGSGEPAGDGAQAPAVLAPESGSGAGEPTPAADAAAAAASAREEMIAEARRAAREEWARLSAAQPSAPAATPPTASQGVVAQLQAEGLSIQAEDARLRAAITRDGLTAQNLYDQSELTRRESRFAAQVNLLGLQESDRRQAIDARAPKDDEARAKAFKAYAAQHGNVDPDLLADAFATKWAREHPAKAPAAAPASPAPAGRTAVNVSGPSEVTARDAKARTMTIAQQREHRASLRAEGKDAEAAKFDRDIRNNVILTKG